MPFEFSHIIFGIVLFVVLGALSWIDAKTFRLPNTLTYPLIAVGIGSSFVLDTVTPNTALIGMGVGYLGFVMIERLFKHIYGKEGLGRGDAKLLAAGGAWCGWFGLPYIILLASLCGLIFTQMPSQRSKSKEQTHFPFGPFLSLGIMIVWLTSVHYQS